MTLTEILEHWVDEAARMESSSAHAVVVTVELFAQLVREQGSEAPVVARLPVAMASPDVSPTGDSQSLNEMVEVRGPDRVTVYVGRSPTESTFPLGYDPAMPVFCVPVPPETLLDGTQLEMYNRLRWYGIPPDEALAGSRS